MTPRITTVDALLVGGGIMSATLAILLHELDPFMTVELHERLDTLARESSAAMNNAGTGHAAYCEMNYTPEQADGSVDISKTFSINESFEQSLQLWSYLVTQGSLPEASRFMAQVPHMSFVHGEENVRFLEKRYSLMGEHHFFRDMVYSQDRSLLTQWAPLVMKERAGNEPLAATRVERGTDVDFGELARYMISSLQKTEGFTSFTSSEVRDIKREDNGRWKVAIRNGQTGEKRVVSAGFVFIGAGGGSLPLLQKSGIPEGRGYGGMPVSGRWLVCSNPEIVEQHNSKVYGRAPKGAPPMSVPHLDTRVINGKKSLLFGPYAGFTTRYLKEGSLMDLPASLKPSTIGPMVSSGAQNLSLVTYLVDQVIQSKDRQLDALREFFPSARKEDWNLEIAGLRVQTIKPEGCLKGKLEFGTKVVASKDGTLAALLGASPGASTAVTSMAEMLLQCFPSQKDAWHKRLQMIIPTWGRDLVKDEKLTQRTRKENNQVLGINV